MASAGAQCGHVAHVSTQLPYAMTVAAVTIGALFVLRSVTAKGTAK